MIVCFLVFRNIQYSFVSSYFIQQLLINFFGPRPPIFQTLKLRRALSSSALSATPSSPSFSA